MLLGEDSLISAKIVRHLATIQQTAPRLPQLLSHPLKDAVLDKHNPAKTCEFACFALLGLHKHYSSHSATGWGL